jgi:hypothetical protein
VSFLTALQAPAVSALIGAGVALLVSWMGRRSDLKQRTLAREIKLSEFRQAWINSLRDAIADFGAITSVRENWNNNQEQTVGLVFKIEMMMNPNDPDYETLRKALKYRADAQALGGTERLNPSEDNLLEVSQRILKREWDRLKSDLARSERAQKP